MAGRRRPGAVDLNLIGWPRALGTVSVARVADRRAPPIGRLTASPPRARGLEWAGPALCRPGLFKSGLAAFFFGKPF
jgi:hypothetical protein